MSSRLLKKNKFIIYLMLVITMLTLAFFPACDSEDESSELKPELVAVEELLLLNKAQVNVMVGQTLSLKVISENKDTISWSSMDESIATVENGVIVGVKSGETKVVATINDYNKATCVVIVLPNKVDAYCITSHMDDTQIMVGMSLQLVAEVVCGKQVVEGATLAWSVENENIATVQNGLVVGKEAGTTKVYAEYVVDADRTVRKAFTITVLANGVVA